MDNRTMPQDSLPAARDGVPGRVPLRLCSEPIYINGDLVEIEYHAAMPADADDVEGHYLNERGGPGIFRLVPASGPPSG